MTWFAKKTFVVPIDLSEHSINALNQVLEMADSPSNIHVLHVLHDELGVAPEFGVSVLDVDAQIRGTTQLLYDQFKDEKYRGIKMHVGYGDPGTEIAKYAEDIKADLIVISSHGRRGWQRILIGSVAERVVRLAHCPVFVLKSRQGIRF